jgi:hypothetical protein
MVVLDSNFALGCRPRTDYTSIHISVYAMTNKYYSEPITFVLAYSICICENGGEWIQVTAVDV